MNGYAPVQDQSLHCEVQFRTDEMIKRECSRNRMPVPEPSIGPTVISNVVPVDHEQRKKTSV